MRSLRDLLKEYSDQLLLWPLSPQQKSTWFIPTLENWDYFVSERIFSLQDRNPFTRFCTHTFIFSVIFYFLNNFLFSHELQKLILQIPVWTIRRARARRWDAKHKRYSGIPIKWKFCKMEKSWEIFVGKYCSNSQFWVIFLIFQLSKIEKYWTFPHTNFKNGFHLSGFHCRVCAQAASQWFGNFALI